MVENAFIGRPKPPTDDELSAALGPAARALWDGIVEALAARHGAAEREWSSYSKTAGWSLRLKKKGRAIVYLTPGRSAIGASFALADAALAEARAAGFDRRIAAILAGAKRYAEGSAVRLSVESAADVTAVEKLAAIKIAH